MTSGELLAAALRYAELGYRVFPCVPSGKAPFTEHGFHDASAEADQIECWWAQHPCANIGLPAEGLLVIDIDGESNPWPIDPNRCADLAQAGAIALTPRGGKHYVFRRPADKAWRCTEGRLANQVDTRTDGGYIVVAPSVIEGTPYRWAPGLELDDPADRLPQPPVWLVQELDRLVQNGNGSPTLANVATGAAEANEIPDGQRNATLARLGGNMRRVGMTAAEIAAALHQTNQDRCIPPLPPIEVDRIAHSIARYPPDEVSVALAENHWAQSKPPQIAPVSLDDLRTRYPELRPPVIHGLLRRGETMNVISAPKAGKSWLVTDLALAVATGRAWLDAFACEVGDVLIIDNELHAETSANRIPKVAAARNIELDVAGKHLFVQNLRGHWQDIFSLGPYFRSLDPGRFRVIILDAMYRFMPREMDENDNGTMANVYNAIDRYADQLGCCFVLIHHTSKGNQSSKAVTDVGAGAGSQSRATDTHLILRPHEEEDVVVLDAAVRSWPPATPRCLRWTFPVWTPADDLDPALLRIEKPKRRERVAPADEKPEIDWSTERFVEACIAEDPKTKVAILDCTKELGLSKRRAELFLQDALFRGLIHRWQEGRYEPVVYSTRPREQHNG